MTLIERYFPFVGRILLSLIFLISGVGKFLDWSGNVAYAEQNGLVAVPVLLAIAGVIEILGAATLITGLYARLGALVLFGLLAGISVIFHDFWTPTGSDAQMQMAHFLKNLAIMGGLLYVVVTGPGKLSLGTGKYTRV